ncbi:hypothetical protein FHT03_003519 [Xanthomonas arboricola]
MSASNDVADIRVSFDIEQISSDLLWNVINATDRKNLCSPFGRYASAIYLCNGDEITIEVTAYGKADDLVTINVVDAVLCSIPHTNATKFSAPSPFSKVRATVPVEQWSLAEPLNTKGKRAFVVQRSITPLEVVQKDGRWKISLIITVLIERKTKDGTRSEIRVFSFDPEAEVGSGTEPTECLPAPYTP